MRRNFLLGLIVCLIPTAIAGFYVARGFARESAGETGFRRGIDLAGGTILVYEVKTPEGKDATLTSEDIKKLAENLKRRIDPADLRNVVVRPVGASRVEIILPFAGSTGGGKEGANEDFVREVRALVGQAGVLEFRIVANPVDDRDGIKDARDLLARADADPKFRAELDDRARRGLAPPAPDKTYTVTVNNNTQDDVRYEWVELGREERDTYGLSNAYATEAPKARRSGGEGHWLYPVLAQQRGKTVEWGNMLLYSREYIETVKPKDEENKKVEYYVLTRVSKNDSFRVAGDIKLSARVDQRDLNPAVGFTFNAAGANQFGRVTERNRKDSNGFKRQLAVILDQKVVSAPTLDAVIRDAGQISGESFDLGGVTRLVYILRSGALNAELKPDPVSENTVGPTLGQDTIRKGLIAVGLSFAAVLLFMVGYYRFAGIVACVALFVNLLLTVGFMLMVNAAFTLPGLAGIVLMLGMAVDANVLIYERLREERDKGANLVTAIRLGYDRAFATIIDTHLTSIFTAIVLYTFGNDNLKGFAVSLTVGLIISLFTSLYMTRLMFDFWLHKRWLTALKMHQLFPRPNINFMKVRNLMFAITGALTVLGLALFLARGESVLNVDFTKGTAYGGRLQEGRALNDTDKAGLLTLLGERQQAERLKVTEVVPLAGGESGTDASDTSARSSNEHVYKIKYADNTEATVTFANPPEGAGRDAQLADVRERAQHLPGLSVEQVYVRGIDDDLPFGVSRSCGR
jgi:SecD/SecF fusion protein